MSRGGAKKTQYFSSLPKLIPESYRYFLKSIPAKNTQRSVFIVRQELRIQIVK